MDATGPSNQNIPREGAIEPQSVPRETVYPQDLASQLRVSTLDNDYDTMYLNVENVNRPRRS